MNGAIMKEMVEGQIILHPLQQRKDAMYICPPTAAWRLPHQGPSRLRLISTNAFLTLYSSVLLQVTHQVVVPRSGGSWQLPSSCKYLRSLRSKEDR
eukprot:scaffold16744_cov18-Tisochrysis_lutea.AAC.1